MTYICKNGLPHRYVMRADERNATYEICDICGDKQRWNKDSRGRIDNKEYVKAHAREFAQPYGRTGKLYAQLYGEPQNIKKKGSNADFQAKSSGG